MPNTMIPSRSEVAQATWFQARLPQSVLLMTAGGFGLTLIELMLIGHHEKTQVMGLVVCGIGLLMSVLGLVAQGIWRKVVVGVLVLVALEGFAGTLIHRIGDPAKPREEQAAVAVQPEKGDEHGGEHHAPPLAPLSIMGLAVLASMAIAARSRVSR